MKKKDGMGLEEALESLEQVVQSLENGKMGLEECLNLYEKGMGLVRLCEGRLQSAERRIECLTGELPADLQPPQEGEGGEGDEGGDRF